MNQYVFLESGISGFSTPGSYVGIIVFGYFIRNGSESI